LREGGNLYRQAPEPLRDYGLRSGITRCLQIGGGALEVVGAISPIRPAVGMSAFARIGRREST
jgi:hypothetical protein